MTNEKNVLIFQRQVSAVTKSHNVAVRNAEILAQELGADLLLHPTDRAHFDKHYDVIICAYSNRYIDFTTLKRFIDHSGGQRRFLLRTEYERVGSLITEYKPFEEICNFEGGSNYMNTNLLVARYPNDLCTKKYDCIYYSRYRADRMVYCAKYLQGDIYLSTHPKNHKWFYHGGCRPKLIKGIDWTPGRETLNLFRYSLYMEDVYTHTFQQLGEPLV